MSTTPTPWAYQWYLCGVELGDPVDTIDTLNDGVLAVLRLCRQADGIETLAIPTIAGFDELLPSDMAPNKAQQICEFLAINRIPLSVRAVR